jgi:hypothetical protein
MSFMGYPIMLFSSKDGLSRVNEASTNPVIIKSMRETLHADYKQLAC